jgi:hypothetical protein
MPIASGEPIGDIRRLGRDRAESQEIVGMVGKRRSGRFTLKNERELIAMAANGATASEIAAKFKTSVKTIERKARALGISIKKKPPVPLKSRLRAS